MQNVLRIIKLPYLIFSFLYSIFNQILFIRKYVNPILLEFEDCHDNSLQPKDFEKIRKYYGLSITGIFGASLCKLRGQKMLFEERYTSTFQASITGLVDDYYDEHGMTLERMREFFVTPDEVTPKNQAELLGIQLYKESIKYVNDFNALVPFLDNVNQAQSDSMQQVETKMDFLQLKMLTLYKGGSSFLYYRSAFRHPFKKNEEKALYLLGGITQLSNDIFDVYKDRENGVQTLLTITKDIGMVKDLYKKWIKEFEDLFICLDYSPGNIQSFLQLYHLGVFSRCFVCLDQLISLQEKSEGVFELQDYSREELICDMEQYSNLTKSIKYSI
ncbi:hypothetical protein [Flammeovirga agarivorans]|uniref:Uncharacterized protein n=1 Tax=Flammeovirga agarivorans TaxID=2726742 RepID=A0A7X8XUW3_9BACT|nr:hypothetical protein [Flammeovirga agarivorans]NLR90485.1 hypothetical protein [Flammeovirga agarivorans]